VKVYECAMLSSTPHWW